MGEYIFIKNEEGVIPELKKIYEEHCKKNKDQFKNDFEDINSFEEVFEITDDHTPVLRFKYAIMDKEFYTPEFTKTVFDLVKSRGLDT